MQFKKEIIHFLTENNVDFKIDNNCICCNNLNINTIKIGSKTIISSKNSINLHEDVWLHKKEIVKSRILSMLGKTKTIYGRNTKVKTIDNQELNKFLQLNHLNVPLKGKFRYSLIYNNIIVAVAVFSKSRNYYRNNSVYKSYELIRYCSILNHTVVGGLSKLIKHFINEVKPDDIVTYIDKEWSEGKSFIHLGFIILGETPNQTFYINPNTYEREYSNLNDDSIAVSNIGNYKLMLDLKNG